MSYERKPIRKSGLTHRFSVYLKGANEYASTGDMIEGGTLTPPRKYIPCLAASPRVREEEKNELSQINQVAKKQTVQGCTILAGFRVVLQLTKKEKK